MDESEAAPVSENPRFLLLPTGCKDLSDALRMRGPLRGESLPATPKSNFELSKYPLGSPANVVLPDPVPVSDLAETIDLPIHQIIRVLMHFHIYVTPTDLIEFTTAKSLCALCGVEASRTV